MSVKKIKDEKKLLKSYRLIVDCFSVVVLRIQYDKGKPQQYMIFLLYASLLDYAYGIYSLFGNKNYWVVPVALRSMSEVFVDLMHVINDDKYIYNIELQFQNQSQKYGIGIESIEKLKHVASSEEYKKEMETIAGEIQKLKDKGAKQLSIEQKFDGLDLGEIYHSMYRLLCGHSHNNIDALEERHLVKSGKDDYHIKSKKDMDEKDKMTYIYTILGMIHDASVTIVNNLDGNFKQLSDCINKYKPLRDKMKTIIANS